MPKVAAKPPPLFDGVQINGPDPDLMPTATTPDLLDRYVMTGDTIRVALVNGEQYTGEVVGYYPPFIAMKFGSRSYVISELSVTYIVVSRHIDADSKDFPLKHGDTYYVTFVNGDRQLMKYNELRDNIIMMEQNSASIIVRAENLVHISENK
jgi:sRNA-binding regulator protein Hfq